MGAGALTICVSTTPPVSSHTRSGRLNVLQSSEKVDLWWAELCVYVTHAWKFLQPRWGHLQPACFCSQPPEICLGLSSLSSCCSRSSFQLFQWPPTWGQRRGRSGGGHMLGLAIFFISNVETDRKTPVLVFETRKSCKHSLLSVWGPQIQAYVQNLMTIGQQ